MPAGMPGIPGMPEKCLKKTWKNCMLKNLYRFLINDDDFSHTWTTTHEEGLITIQEKR